MATNLSVMIVMITIIVTIIIIMIIIMIMIIIDDIVCIDTQCTHSGGCTLQTQQVEGPPKKCHVWRGFGRFPDEFWNYCSQGV